MLFSFLPLMKECSNNVPIISVNCLLLFSGMRHPGMDNFFSMFLPFFPCADYLDFKTVHKLEYV